MLNKSWQRSSLKRDHHEKFEGHLLYLYPLQISTNFERYSTYKKIQVVSTTGSGLASKNFTICWLANNCCSLIGFSSSAFGVISLQNPSIWTKLSSDTTYKKEMHMLFFFLRGNSKPLNQKSQTKRHKNKKRSVISQDFLVRHQDKISCSH